MIHGKCPKCGSQSVYSSINGVTPEGKKIYVRNVSRLTSSTDRRTYLCTKCGYFENYVMDRGILESVEEKWDKV